MLPIFYNFFTGDPDVCLLDASTDISTNMSTHAVSLKMPDFWESSALAWFAQTEAQFALREITADATKYYYVVSALENSTATRVASFLTNPHEEEKYKTFKTHLLKAFELSDEERVSRLFSIQVLGDNKPSELMDRMLDLMGAHKPDFLFNQLFLRQLPSQVRAALANTAITDCRALAKEADKFFIAGQPHGAAAPFPVQSFSPATGQVAVLARQRLDGLCFYHAKFGPKAKRCRSPCSFDGTGNATAGGQ